MRHLYASRVALLRMKSTYDYREGPEITWQKVATIIDRNLGVVGEFKCRLDLNFIRLGKDAPMAVESGRAPDRVGVMFCDYSPDIKAGDRIRTISGPVMGVFEIRQIPDVAVAFSQGHHIECSIIEVAQSLEGVFPGAYPEE